MLYTNLPVILRCISSITKSSDNIPGIPLSAYSSTLPAMTRSVPATKKITLDPKRVQMQR